MTKQFAHTLENGNTVMVEQRKAQVGELVVIMNDTFNFDNHEQPVGMVVEIDTIVGIDELDPSHDRYEAYQAFVKEYQEETGATGNPPERYGFTPDHPIAQMLGLHGFLVEDDYYVVVG